MIRISVTCLAVLIPVSWAAAADDALDKAPSRFAKLNDIRVHYKSLGAGDTALVFIHGWTCDLTFWRAQVPAFDGKVRVVLIDLPGHGQSDKPKIDYTMDLFAKSIDAVLKDAGVEKAVLAGHSMGTPVVRQYYRLFPKTLALIAVDGSLRPYVTDPAQIEQFIARFQSPNFKEAVGGFVDSMFTPETPADVRARVKATMTSAPQHVAVSAMKGMMDPSIWKEDPITVPLQTIVTKNPLWSGDYEKHVRKLAPQVDYQVMEGVGHFLMMEKPQAFNDILAGFLKKQGVTKP